MTASNQPDDPQAARAFAVQVVRRLREHGYQALWAGGCVRDQRLGLTPKDYDVATDARPDDVRKIFGRRRTHAVGAAFGVITVRGPRTAGQIEVATFRCDGEYRDGRHPDSVTFSSAREDALRRDFTINGLFFDPLSNELIDYVDGERDLKAGVIRAIGNPRERFEEDKLRMLRAIRFATQFEFRLDPETAAALREQADQLWQVSPERIAAELRTMWSHPRCVTSLQLLAQTGLWPRLLPEAALLPNDASRDWTRLLTAIEALPAPQFCQVLAAIAVFAPLSLSALKELCRNWRLSTDERELGLWLRQYESTIRSADRLPWPQVQRLLVHPAAPLAVELAQAVARARQEEATGIDFAVERLRWPRERLDPRPLLDGHDLLRLGIPAGPQLGELLQSVRDRQLEGTLNSSAEAKQWILKNHPPS